MRRTPAGSRSGPVKREPSVSRTHGRGPGGTRAERGSIAAEGCPDMDRLRTRAAAARRSVVAPRAGEGGVGRGGEGRALGPLLPPCSSHGAQCAGGGAGAMAAQDGGGEVRVLQSLRGKICKCGRGRVRVWRAPCRAEVPPPCLLLPRGGAGGIASRRRGEPRGGGGAMAAGARCVRRAGRCALRAGTCRGRRERRGSRNVRGSEGGPAGRERHVLRCEPRAALFVKQRLRNYRCSGSRWWKGVLERPSVLLRLCGVCVCERERAR